MKQNSSSTVQVGGLSKSERAGHEAFSRLTVKHPIAAALLHTLLASVGKESAVVVSQKTLAALVGVTDRSIRTAVQTLVAQKWIQVVRLNGPGTVAAYVVNTPVIWDESSGGFKSEELRLATFTATVVADADDQDMLDHDLRKIPMIYPLNAGGKELSADEQERAELEARGQLRLDKGTDENQGI